MTVMDALNLSNGALVTASCVLLAILCDNCNFAYNIDVWTRPASYSGPQGSYFGFSVSMHRISNQASWLMVGAPEDNSIYQSSLTNPGTVYACQVSSFRTGDNLNCAQARLDDQGNERKSGEYQDIKDDQWLGIAMDSRAANGNWFVACAHLWRNDFRSLYNDSAYKHWPPHGICYIRNGDPFGAFNDVQKVRFQEFYHIYHYNESRSNIPGFGGIMAGMSVHIAKDGRIFIGTPGVGQHYHFNGGISIYDPIQKKHIYPSDIVTSVPVFSFQGYALTTGNVLSRNQREYNVISGAPAADGVGRVLIYEMTGDDRKNAIIKHTFTGDQYMTYYGSALSVVDVNGDGWDDLFIGAPFHKIRSGDEGIVEVYYGGSDGITAGPTLSSNKAFSRFGTSITFGDLDGDGYNDIIIGGPYEDGRGAVYVYNGSPRGISAHFQQRITAAQLTSINPSAFGYSITSNNDVDKNGYDDLVVGAYASDQVVLLLSRPVININVDTKLQEVCVSPELHVCKTTSDKSYPCFDVTINFNWDSYKPTALNSQHRINFLIEMDEYEANRRRALFVTGPEGGDKRSREDYAILRRLEEARREYKIQIPKNPMDRITPIVLNIGYSLEDPSITRRDNPYALAPIINQTMENTLTAEIPFCKQCRAILTCETDLQVNLISDTSRYLVGQKNPIEFTFEFVNGLDGAYNSLLNFEFPRGMAVLQESISADFEGHTCLRITREDGDPMFEYLACDIGNPIPANTTRRMSFMVDRVQTDLPLSLRFSASVQTKSTEKPADLHNNNKTLILQSVYDAELQAKGLSNPSKVVAISKSSETAAAPRQSVTHVISIENKGPGIVPQFQVIVLLPEIVLESVVFTVSNPKVLYDGSRSEDDAGCKILAGDEETDTYTTGGAKSQKLVSENPDERNSMVLAATEDSFFTLSCSIASLTNNERVDVSYKIAVEFRDETNAADVGEFQYTASVKLPKYFGNLDCGAECQTLEIMTSILPPSPEKSIPLWIIIASAAGGALLLILLILLLWKLGFFRRQRHDDAIEERRESKRLAKSLIVNEEDTTAKVIEDVDPQTPQEEKAAMESYVKSEMGKD